MHPAYSVLFFTTLSGAGYGLLIWLALEAAFGAVGEDAVFGAVGMALALGLVAAGLLASTAHLGRPERAWRAFSQWQTSWLSREGVLALATFAPAGLMGLLWVFGRTPTPLMVPLGLLTIGLALATVVCTGMIYQSLTTIRAWNMPLVSPVYVVLALATGATLLHLLLLIFDYPAFGTGLIAILLLAVSAAMKFEYWRRIDGAERTITAGAATGLGAFGRVRVLDPPHTQANYVMREMGYTVARRHAEKLRLFALVAAFALPILALLLSFVSVAALALLLAVVAVLSMAIGVFTERWLFFAEAQHVVTVFYGAEKA